MDNVYKEHIDILKEKIAREAEMKTTVTLKRKHLSKLRELLFREMKYDPSVKEIDEILYEAMQRI